MKKKIILISLAITSTLAFNMTYAKEPKNLDFVKLSLVRYHDSGEYQKDQARTIDKAMEYLKSRLERAQRTHKNKKMAVVLDIDETALSNYPDLYRMGFGGSPLEINSAIDKGVDAAIAPTLKLYRYAKANNISVFFITGRTEKNRASTEKNLAASGYQNWDGISLRADDFKDKSAAAYKINARNLIEKQGYVIVLNIGDQQSDLTGGHADKTFKLPNPYYFIP
ncbi:MAG: HAD family acid phosphatase [Gammaproteobacteria bacterium]